MKRSSYRTAIAPCILLFLLSMLTISPGVLAQTFSIPVGSNLNTYPPATSTTTWNLLGNAFISDGVSPNMTLVLPAGAPGLTINGAAGGSTITLNDNSSHYASLLSNTPATLNLSNITFTGSNGSSFSKGGAISINTGGPLTINGDLKVTHAVAPSGGAVGAFVSLAVNGNVNIDDATTTVAEGGGISVTGLSISGTTTITNSRATTQGGAILDNNVLGTTSFGNNITLNNNASNKTGGALQVTWGNVVINGNATMNDNHANATTVTPNSSTNMQYGGGAIYTELGGNVTITGNAVMNNNGATTVSSNNCGGMPYGTGACTLRGGAINANGNSSGGTVTITGTATLNGNSITSNGAATTTGGGAIYTRTLNIGGVAQINNNSATATLGNAFAAGGALYTTAMTFSSGATLNDNHVTSSGTSLAYGGALYTSTVSFGGAGTLSNNSATASGTGVAYGGAAYVNTGNFNIPGIAVLNNNAATSGAAGSGGAVYLNAGSAIFGNTATLNGNRMTAAGTGNANGGAIAAFQTVTFNGAAQLNDNTATTAGSGGGFGGAIFANANGGSATPAVTFTGNATLNGNTAKTSGGAVYANAEATFQANATLGHNTATLLNGGAINAPVISIAGDAAFDTNTVGTNGGALYALDITGTGGALFSNNSAASGGAIFAARDISLTTPASGNSIFTNNQATTGMGGALYLEGGPINGFSTAVTSGSLTLNAATGDILFSGNHQASGANAIAVNNASHNTTVTFTTAASRSIVFRDPIMNTPANGLLAVTKNGSGLLSFNGIDYGSQNDRWSQVYGTTQINSGTFEIANNAAYGVQAATVSQSIDSTFTMASGTTLQGGGATSALNADTATLDGITFSLAGQQPTVRNTFTLNSKNASLDGSQLQFNTFLNSGASQNTDKLVVNNANLAGNATVSVTNAGGPGAQTTGNGILLVEINGGNSNAVLTLAAPVQAGGYNYTLVKVGNNWYLQSTGTGPGPSAAPIPTLSPLGLLLLMSALLGLGMIDRKTRQTLKQPRSLRS